MIDEIRTILITEPSDLKKQLTTFLHQRIRKLVVVDSTVDGLAAVKRTRYDAAIVSADMDDYYSVDSMVKILQDVGSIQYILLISEQEPDPNPDPSIQRKKNIIGIKLENPTQCSEQIASILGDLSTRMEEDKRYQRTMGDELVPVSDRSTPLFDSVPTGLYRIDLEGNFIQINQTLAAMLRAPNQEAVKSDNYFSLFNDQDEKHTWLEIIRRDDVIHGYVFEIERYDGQTIWVRDTVRAVLDDKGTQIFFDGSVEDITYQKKLEDKLSFLATQDILTGLPNRNFFQDQAKLTVSQARYTEDLVAFLVVDLDHFSMINETYSHKNGDRVLQLLAGRLKGQLRKSDLVSRLGGDKFIALLGGIRNRRDALAVAKKISQVFDSPFEVQDMRIEVSGSIGISLYPEHGDEVNTLIKRAEIATLAVKERERGGYMVYSDVIHTSYESHV